MLAGDPAYPLLPWLMKGYTGALTPEQESFNIYLSFARICARNAFGRLKARWRVLLCRAGISNKFMPSVAQACVILHNIVEISKDNFNPCWLRSVNEVNMKRPQPRQVIVTLAEPDTKHIRDVLKNYMTDKYPLRQSVQDYARRTM